MGLEENGRLFRKHVGRRRWIESADKRDYNGASSRNIQSSKDDQISKAIKHWKWAVTIFRTNMRMPWGEVSRKLEAITKRKSEVSQVAVDRAIFWCLEDQELEGLLLKSEQLSTHKTLVKVER